MRYVYGGECRQRVNTEYLRVPSNEGTIDFQVFFFTGTVRGVCRYTVQYSVLFSLSGFRSWRMRRQHQ